MKTVLSKTKTLFLSFFLLSLGDRLFAHESSTKKFKSGPSEVMAPAGLLSLPSDLYVYKLMPIKGVREALRGVCKKLNQIATKKLPDTKIHIYNEKELFNYLEKPIHHRPILMLHFVPSKKVFKYITYLSHPLDISGLIIDGSINLGHFKALLLFIKKIPRLDTLGLSMNLTLDQFEEFVAPILGHLKSLKNLSLKITDEDEDFFIDQNNFLYLDIFLKYFVSYQTIEKLKFGFGTQDNNVDIALDDNAKTSFRKLLLNSPNLKSLIFFDAINEYDNSGLFKTSTPLANIKKIKLGTYSAYSLSKLSLHQAFPLLSTIGISSYFCCESKNEIVDFFSKFTNLKSLHLSDFNFDYKINLYTLVMLLPGLKKLKIDSDCNEMLNEFLNPTFHDKILNFHYNYNLSLSNLETVDVYQNTFLRNDTKKFLFYFVSLLPKLKELKCHDVGMDDKDVSYIIRLINEKKASSGYQIKHISLKGNAITNAGLELLYKAFQHTTSDDFVIDLRQNAIDKSQMNLNVIPSSIKL